ncbi:MAG: helix-turn-helix domain-containing protein [Opitutaceae bacterium]|nr:helix-turn-helix domain-containing protein [Opitutaceae bacterium]
MKKAAFNDLLQSVRTAGAYLRGGRKDVARVDRISPDSIAAVRARLGLSQAQFARAIGISLDTLQNWEQGRRKPTGPAKVLLQIAARHPETVLEAVA